ncbi:L-histidine N(alpha)-methyltransferase [Polymorphobacter fuscus]|uniref:L-histidine N(Alpha)-methyltransferase n=1 Tax=Sandarakinorhabdus fusca TaxID=1439888 RepID=A0A7C9KHX6_9SPHN|nr:L-histidine N(alpha)-methyltransferase [Polymorphobacter fuscus]KAB7647537.1 L-histidine N(alpha)-methyltransferase [Polymorphobacter fuscus]MQT16799.1 L-histidine N(alpha)-methyltransferase [Polymorphobacter fuscus]NJC09212.1 dimethylhistidine N-methyltransferase [Polymorphobacter fuscus]
MARPLLVQDEVSDFAAAVRAGLAQPQKVIPARFFYDRLGSELFEAITDLPEYYPTRTEVGLLAGHAADIAAAVGPGRAVIEFGSGSSVKTPLLLRAIAPATYVPVDISAEFLALSAAALSADFPGLPVLPVAADFTRPFQLPARAAAAARLGFFPGSTLGNLAPGAAVDLLRSFAATLGSESWLLIGLDLAPGASKSAATLEAAYDDAQGVTAAFNLNLLHRINRELDGDMPVDAFAHRAVWNAGLGRIEMHLVATRDLAFEAAGERFAMTAGAHIHTENSYKWTADEARLLARASGWTPDQLWTDADGLFSLHLWRRDDGAMQP